MRRQRQLTTIWSAIVLVSSPVVLAQAPAKANPKRAQPPKFDSATATQYFFDDVFTKLIGERPAPGSTPAPPAGAAASVAASSGAAGSAAGGAGWSKLISATTIEDEIKSIKQDIDKNITTPSDFAGRGYKVIRREFSMLAMLFAIIAEYDGEVRFKSNAATASALFARTASNAKAGGNSNVFNEAKLRKTDLEDLLRGSSISAESPGDASGWGSIIDRSPLMQRLESSFQTQLSPSLSNQGEFEKNSDKVARQGELIAVMAEVLTKPDMSDADDETYAEFAKSMKEAAREVVDAVKLKNYDQARAAAGKIDKACSQCHEGYR